MVVVKGLGYAGCTATRLAPCHCRLARRLAVILHRMWTDGTDFRWGSEPITAVP